MKMVELLFEDDAPGAAPGEPYQRLETPQGDDWALLYRGKAGAYLIRFPDFADFCVSADMGAVRCRLRANADRETATHLYRNQVWPLMQSHRGKLVFHASAVLVGDAALAFVGVSGRGKSTLAASFASAGCPFLADDGLVVCADTDGYWVESGLNSVRLWEDSVAALQPHLSNKAPGLSFTEKERYLATDALPHFQGRVRLKGLFLLGEGAGYSCTPLDATQRLVEWLRHSFILDVEDKNEVSAHFDGLSRLAMDVRAFRLDYPRSYEALAQTRAFILRQLDSLT